MVCLAAVVPLKGPEQEVYDRSEYARKEFPLLLAQPRRSGQRLTELPAEHHVESDVGCDQYTQDVVEDASDVPHTAAKISAIVDRVDTGTSMRAISAVSSARTAAAMSAADGPLLPPLVLYPMAIPGTCLLMRIL